MRTALLIILFVLPCCSHYVKAQSSADSLQRKAFYRYLNTIRFQRELNESEVERYVPLAEQFDGRTFKGAGMLGRTPNYYKLLIDYTCDRKQTCKGTLLVTYNPDGSYNSSLTFTESMGSCLVGSLTNFLRQNKDMIITRQGFWQNSCSEKGEETEMNLYIMREYRISDDGYLKLVHHRMVDNERRYPNVSIHNMSDLDLEVYSNEELDYMRNELFASYGYRFKSERWAYVFEDKPWYQPKVSEVPLEWLSTIEKENLELILAQKAKRKKP